MCPAEGLKLYSPGELGEVEVRAGEEPQGAAVRAVYAEELDLCFIKLTKV